MPTIINISPSSLLTLGSSSLSSSDDKDGLEVSASLLTTTAVSISAAGDDYITINGRAEELRTTKAYVASLSEEEKNTMMDLLTKQEESIKLEEPKQLTLRMQNDKKIKS